MLVFDDAPLVVSLKVQAMPDVCASAGQGLANAAWAYAVLDMHQGPVFATVCGTVLLQLLHFDAQNLSTLMWSFATLRTASDGPLFEASGS